MRLSTFLLVTVATLAQTQDFGDEPECAKKCLPAAISAAGCAISDQSCQCSDEGKAAIQKAGTQCLVGNCDANDLAKAYSVGIALCVAYSSTLTMGSMSTSPTPSASTTGTTTGPEIVTSIRESSSAATGTDSTSSKGTSAGITSPPASSATGATLGPAGVGSSSAPASTSTGGAAVGAKVGMGGVAGLVLGLLGAL